MSGYWIDELDSCRTQLYSQCWEDGVIEKIFHSIGTTGKYFVDIGASDGVHNSNTANLRLNHGWKGLLLDKKPKKDIVHEAFVNAENINQILSDYDVPDEFDLLSLDIDGVDYYVWKALKYKPRVVVVEFNPNFLDSRTVKYDPEFSWDGTNYYGASLKALQLLGMEKGYSLIYQADYLNAFFISHKIKNIEYPLERFMTKTFPAHKPDTLKREWMIVEKR